MSKQNAVMLAHELTMEYIKRRTVLNDPAIDNIPEIVESVADINKRFYDAIVHNEILGELYQ